MELNKETALRLWNKSFGKATKVKDFTGREISKGAYNDRNSNYGWNVDHILPVSRGGKTADHNLIICNIVTNDEKADKFPAFTANGKQFEIRKVENHYEIFEKNNSNNGTSKEETFNLLDSACGIRYFKKLKGIQNKNRFVGVVTIELQNVTNNAVMDFIEKVFESENIIFQKSSAALFNQRRKVIVTNNNMPNKEDSQELLNKCVLLNTYLKYYFTKIGYVDGYRIKNIEKCFEDKDDLYDFDLLNEQNRYPISAGLLYPYNTDRLDNKLYINNLVYHNTDAEEDCPDYYLKQDYELMEYDYHFTRLARNLEKEVDE